MGDFIAARDARLIGFVGRTVRVSYEGCKVSDLRTLAEYLGGGLFRLDTGRTIWADDALRALV